MEDLFSDLDKKMEKAIDALKKDFDTVRTGRANPAILDSVSIDYYGTPTPVSGVGNITVPDPQMIMITPWEKNMLAEIGKAIMSAGIGLNPQNDGNVIRIPIPPLNEERRKELVKQTRKMGEECKISIRNARRDANDKVKKQEKDKEISKDEEKGFLDRIQKKTDEYVKTVDQLTATKEKELMEI